MPSNAGKRIEPLFTSADDAREVMRAYCMRGVDSPLTSSQVEFLISRLQPQLWLARRQGGGGPGETRFGGAADLPLGTLWPERPSLPDVAKRASESKWPNAWIIRQLSEAVPFEFVGQIDLAEAARFAPHANDLPSAGRLLFFLDMSVLMEDPIGGSNSCRVIHDETPSADLERLPFPAKFMEMEAWWRAPDPMAIEHFRKMARDLEAAGQKAAAKAMLNAARKSEKPDPTNRKPFVHPSRAMQLAPLMVLPRPNALELTGDKELMDFANGDETEEHYSLLTSHDTGPFTGDRSGLRRTQDWLTIQARQNRFMGPPDPEQDDPRYAVLDKFELPPYHWNAAQTAQMSSKAQLWQLLLQVSIADLSQQQTEGTVYFMIRKADLASRDFSRVTATYQQT